MAPSKKPKKLSKPAYTGKSTEKSREPTGPPLQVLLEEEEETSGDSEHSSDNDELRNTSGEDLDREIARDVRHDEVAVVEDEDSEEEIQVPQKRKAAPKTNTKSLLIILFLSSSYHFLLEKVPKRADPTDQENTNANEDESQQEIPQVVTIAYTITAFSLEELKKPATRRKAKSRLIELSSNLDWMDLHGHLKITICDLLFPQQAVVGDDRYEMTWCIPRHVPQALSLATTADYNQLVKKALKMKEPGVKILVDEIAGNAVRKSSAPQILLLINHPLADY
jgi:hypothetical protein